MAAPNKDLITVTKRITFLPCLANKLKYQNIVRDGQIVKSTTNLGNKDEHTVASSGQTDGRKLVIMMSWLNAREKHINYYRNFYLERGFDVLNIKTSPVDLMLPQIGASVSSRNLVKFLDQHNYPQVVIHGFSIAGYVYGQLLLDIFKLDKEKQQQLINSIQGIVLDSVVPFEGAFYGIARTVSSNPIMVALIANTIRAYLFLGHYIAGKRFQEVSKVVWSGPVKCPALFINSKEDVISDYKIIDRLRETWANVGIETKQLLVDNGPHVQLFKVHNDAYVKSVDSFLKKVRML